MGDPVVRLSDEDLTRLADLVAGRVAALLRPEPEPVLLTAQQVADRFGLSAEWVRDHAADLGVIRIGDGPRPRLRFEAQRVVAALTTRTGNEKSEPRVSPASARDSVRGEPSVSGSGVAALPVRELKPRCTRKESPGAVAAARGVALEDESP